jgi:hypothetical protein
MLRGSAAPPCGSRRELGMEIGAAVEHLRVRLRAARRRHVDFQNAAAGEIASRDVEHVRVAVAREAEHSERGGVGERRGDAPVTRTASENCGSRSA